MNEDFPRPIPWLGIVGRIDPLDAPSARDASAVVMSASPGEEAAVHAVMTIAPHVHAAKPPVEL